MSTNACRFPFVRINPDARPKILAESVPELLHYLLHRCPIPVEPYLSQGVGKCPRKIDGMGKKEEKKDKKKL